MSIKEALEYLEQLPQDAEVEIHLIENKMISSGEVEQLGISRQLLRYYVNAGRVKTEPYGKQKRYLLDDVLKIIG